MQNILVIDDSEDLVAAVESALSPLGLGFDTAGNVQQGLDKIALKKYSLVIIDIGLPDGDGFDLFQKMRNLNSHKKTPVIFLTANEDVGSKISAFALGADDYIVKPFHLLELRARVDRRLKKLLEDDSDHDQVISGPLVLEISSQRVTIAGKNNYVTMTPREFKILLLLTKNPDQIFSREYILDQIWCKDIYVTDRTVDAHICYIRKKLENYSTHIQSVPGEGYRFNPRADHH